MPSASDKPLSGLSLLILEPEAFAQRTLRSILFAQGARTIRICEHLTAAGAMSRALRPDIILLGIEPECPEGLALLSTVAANSTGDTAPRILVTTTCPNSAFVQRIAKAGAHGVILKPFSAQTVLRMMRRMRDQLLEMQQAHPDPDGLQQESRALTHTRFNSR